jgi:hypothetical protein
MRRPLIFLIFASLAVLWACSGNNSPNPVTVALIPGSSQTITQGGTVGIRAMVAYDSANRGVSWKLSGTGTLTGSTGSAVTYNAPGTIASAVTVTITATSVTNPSVSASLQITVQPGIQPGVSVSLTPSAPQTIAQGSSVAVTGSVANDSSHQGVIWSLSPSSGAGTLIGGTGSAVTYNAPGTVVSPVTVTVTATSVTNSSVSASLQITVQPGIPPGLSVSLTPGSLQTIKQGVSFAVTASVTNDSSNRGVTWSLSPSSGAGTLSSVTTTSVNYNAPASVSGDVNATLTATAVADPSAFASLPITVQTAPSAQALNIVIRNLNSAYPDSQVYFSFRYGPLQGTINGQPIVLGNAYSLNDVGSGIQVQNVATRIYFSLGTPLPASTGDPDGVTTSSNAYNIRFDKIEITQDVTALGNTVDLTSIDFFAIPLALQTYALNGSTPLQTLTFTQPGYTVRDALAQLAGPNPSVLLTTPSGSFLRVLGTQLAQAQPAPSPYPSLQSYVNEFSAAGGHATIEDLFNGDPKGGTTPPFIAQCYNFATSFDGSGNLLLEGGGTPIIPGGQSVGQGHKIIIQASDLATGIYSANPPYTVDGNSSTIGVNDVYAAVVRDMLAGFSFGFVNSSTRDPNTGNFFSAEPSTYWWQSTKAYNYLQTASPNYNQYANYLYTVSNAYGQPFSDRWQKVQANWDYTDVTTLEIDILPDTGVVPIQSGNPKVIYPPLSCFTQP